MDKIRKRAEKFKDVHELPVVNAYSAVPTLTLKDAAQDIERLIHAVEILRKITEIAGKNVGGPLGSRLRTAAPTLRHSIAARTCSHQKNSHRHLLRKVHRRAQCLPKPLHCEHGLAGEARNMRESFAV